MKKYFYMLPRCSGKTNMAIYEFLKDPDNTLFVVINIDMQYFVYDRIGYQHKNIITCNNFSNNIFGKRFKTIILDEYLFFSNYKEIYKTISGSINIENLFIYATSKKQYKKSIFDVVINEKRNGGMIYNLIRPIEILSYSAEPKEYKDILYVKINEINDLYYNFLTDPDTILIDKIPTTFETKTIDRSCFQNDKQYDIEILNKWLIDDGENKNLPLYDMPKDINKFTVQKDGRLLIENLVRPLRIKKSNGDDIILADYGDEFYIYYGDRCYSVKNGKIELF